MANLPLGQTTSTDPRTEIEHSLGHLLQSLLELGICASDVHDSALETSTDGVATGHPGGLVGMKATQTVENLARVHSKRTLGQDVMIPLEVVAAVDQGRNPHTFTKDFIERVAGENMYTNGILSAVSDYRDLLTSQLVEAFPDLAPCLEPLSASFEKRPPTPSQTARPPAVVVDGREPPSRVSARDDASDDPVRPGGSPLTVESRFTGAPPPPPLAPRGTLPPSSSEPFDSRPRDPVTTRSNELDGAATLQATTTTTTTPMTTIPTTGLGNGTTVEEERNATTNRSS
ncbi:hypothetical protein JCM10212_003571 [Sporobolomyces blumeae]